MATRSGTKSRLANIGKLWGKAKQEAKQGGSFGEAVPLSPGKYVLQLVHGVIDTFGDARQLMLKWCVIGDGEDSGTICTTWSSLAEDRIVWLARMLGAMGVDLDDTEFETEEDLQELIDKLIADSTVCNGKVREKDGYTNLYINGVANVDSEDLVDPEEVMKELEENLKGGGKKGKKKEDDEEPEAEDDGDEPEFKKGDKAKFSKKVKGKLVEYEGTIKSIKGEKVELETDDNILVCEVGDLEKMEDEEPEDEGGGDDGEAEVDVGSRVRWKDGKKDVEGEITGFTKDDKAIVKPDGSKRTAEIELSDLEVIEDEGGDDEPEASEEPVPEVGDKVVVKVKGKSKSGTIKKVKGDQVHVAVEGIKELVVVAADEVKFETE